jgi:rare lipoprotein A (peptidoglycan hydrolase)
MARYTGLAMLLVFLACFYAQVESLRRKTIAAIPLTGMASWYAASADTAGALTCAMRSTDFGKKYRVCNAENNACVVVRHTEWGPSWALFRQGRIIDLSKEAFLRIADLSRGVVRVTVTQETMPVESDDKTNSR